MQARDKGWHPNQQGVREGGLGPAKSKGNSGPGRGTGNAKAGKYEEYGSLGQGGCRGLGRKTQSRGWRLWKKLVDFYKPQTPRTISQLNWGNAVCLWEASELLWAPVGYWSRCASLGRHLERASLKEESSLVICFHVTV